MNDIRLLSHPIKLHWMGWETDTATLASYGWDLSVEQNVYRDKMCIAARLQYGGSRLYCLSEMERFEYRRYLDRAKMGQAFNMDIPVFQVQMAENIRVHSIGESRDFSPIDAKPRVQEMQIRNIEDFVHFKKVHYDTKEIILQKASLDEVLRFALSKQEPRQEVIRQEMYNREKIAEYKRNSNLEAELRLAL